ncbi:hypothetical protein NLJ89_g10722 [Agrocybe chaxingu]|uniref:Uncharacterized protein n=1 Tax=Agrocybe chaxingu TaxID=84603 RepID=A0A9W8MQ10_9AGAR|nr:hypothetical protein NLJ89_g10722 [Agrocybe chaxingu]
MNAAVPTCRTPSEALGVQAVLPRPARLITELTVEQLEYGLAVLSQHLRRLHPKELEQGPFELVVSGGACAVLLLCSRITAKAIDAYTTNYDHFRHVRAAKDAACQHELQHYPHDWLNWEMLSNVFNHRECDSLFANSLRMNEVVYESKELILYAADWTFQLATKIGQISHMRMAVLSDNAVDAPRLGRYIRDAAHLLRVIVGHNKGPVKRNQWKTWYHEGALLRKEDLWLVEKRYQEIYRSGPGLILN